VVYRMAPVDGAEIALRRVHSQRLAQPLADPVAVVRHFGAMQAQEFALAKWSVGQRTATTPATTDAALQQAIDDGRIIRTHALRPTWHFVAADDLAWIQALTGGRVNATVGHYYRGQGMDAEFFAKAQKVFRRVLRGGNYLTRKQLGDALAASGVDALGDRLAFVVIQSELDGLIASGPMQGKQYTYALVSERIPTQSTLDPDEALVELVRRYFTSHGPATVKDFAWWSSLTVTSIRRGLDLVGSALAREQVDGREYWFAPTDPPAPVKPSTVYILQLYDEFVVGYTESRHLGVAAGLSTTESNNRLPNPILLGSQIVGSWRRVTERGRTSILPQVAGNLTVRQRGAIEAAFARYGAFTDTPVTVNWP
jgi:hypothetical protein